MKPFLNIHEIKEFERSNDGDFKERYASIGNKIGALKLSYSLSILEPGKKVCPFHNHHINEEMFLILEGEGTLRFGDKEYPITKNDVISCPPGGREVAHQIINTGDAELKFFCLSTNEPYDICEQPDSNKVMPVVGDQNNRRLKHIFRLEDEVDYFDGEIDGEIKSPPA